MGSTGKLREKISLAAAARAAKPGRLPVAAKSPRKLGRGEPADLEMPQQVGVENGRPRRFRLDSRRGADLGQHLIVAEIDQHLAEIEIKELGLHDGDRGRANRAATPADAR